MLLDANLLLYATDASSHLHDRARAWLSRSLHGDRRVGLPAQTLAAFVRISTNPRIWERPITAAQASARVRAWLDAGPTWVPPMADRTAAIFGDLVENHHATSNLVPDVLLAALAIEHGLVVMSADTDFARFPEVRWENPLL